MRIAIAHLFAYAAWKHGVDWKNHPKLHASMQSISCQSSATTSRIDRVLEVQRLQHKAALRRATTVAEWIHLLLALRTEGVDVQAFINQWNRETKSRGTGDAIVGGKAVAVGLWLKHPAAMKHVSVP